MKQKTSRAGASDTLQMMLFTPFVRLHRNSINFLKKMGHQ